MRVAHYPWRVNRNALLRAVLRQYFDTVDYTPTLIRDERGIWRERLRLSQQPAREMRMVPRHGFSVLAWAKARARLRRERELNFTS